MQRGVVERAIPARVQKREPDGSGLSILVTSAVTRAVLQLAFAQLMAGGRGNCWIGLRHQRKINPIVMLFKGFTELGQPVNEPNMN